MRLLPFLLAGVSVLSAPSFAQFDPSKVKAEPAVVAARYADPVVPYRTPGLAPGRADFASHDEALAYLRELAARHCKWHIKCLASPNKDGTFPW